MIIYIVLVWFIIFLIGSLPFVILLIKKVRWPIAYKLPLALSVWLFTSLLLTFIFMDHRENSYNEYCGSYLSQGAYFKMSGDDISKIQFSCDTTCICFAKKACKVISCKWAINPAPKEIQTFGVIINNQDRTRYKFSMLDDKLSFDSIVYIKEKKQ
jgi:hypothetical protein